MDAVRTFLINGAERVDRTFRTRLIERYVPASGHSFLDLGAADGYEARALALRGAARAVAVEGKLRALALAREAQEEQPLPNLEIVEGDVRNLNRLQLGSFDAVLCFGLLYHMSDPAALLREIRAIRSDWLLLETHIAPRNRRELRPERRMDVPRRIRLERMNGLEGLRVFQPGDPTKTKGGLDNEWAFWLTFESLIQALTAAGFTIVECWYDALDDAPQEVREVAETIGLGRPNTKLWIAAR
jgi:SAM-dependent methyltransferase